MRMVTGPKRPGVKGMNDIGTCKEKLFRFHYTEKLPVLWFCVDQFQAYTLGLINYHCDKQINWSTAIHRQIRARNGKIVYTLFTNKRHIMLFRYAN